MTNKEKRSIILSMLIGDGNISEVNVNKKTGLNYSGALNINHGMKQRDFLLWKKEILEKIKESPIGVMNKKSHVKALNKTYDQVGISWVSKKFRSWKKIFYQNNVKNIPKILKFIRHPYLAGAVWLMDDGSSTSAWKRLANGSKGPKVFCGFVLYVCDQNKEQLSEICEWWKLNFNVNPRVKWLKMNYKGIKKEYPSIRFTNQDSLKIYELIRPFIIQVESMKHKFQTVEDRRNRSDLPQPPAQ